MAYCALVGSGFLHINLHYNLYEMNEFSWSVYALRITQLTIRLLFFHLQIWSAPNWILQIVFDNYVFFSISTHQYFEIDTHHSIESQKHAKSK